MDEEERGTRNASMAVLAAYSSLKGAFHNMRSVVWQPFVLSLGISMGNLGGLESLMELSRLIVQPVIGGASDAQGRKRWLLVREALSIFIGVLSILAGSWQLLAIVMIFLGFEGALYNVWTALVADSFEAKNLGYTLSVLSAFSTAMGLIATFSAGFIAENYGFKAVFILSTIFSCLSFLLVLFKQHETVSGVDSHFNVREAYRSLVDTLKPPRELWGFYLAMSLDLFAFGMGYRLISGMLSKGYGYTPQMLGLMMTVAMASMTVAQIPAAMFIEKIGYSKYMAIAQMFSISYLGILVFTKRFDLVLLSQVLNGAGMAVWIPAESAWIASNVKTEERARALGSYSTVRTLLSFPAPLIGGFLFDAYGFNVPVTLNIVLALADIVLILYLVKNRVASTD